MRLVKLRANKKSFHTVNFNESGVSIILGRKEHKESKNKKKTYNSVGKSLTIRIIHFCLGCNSIPEFENKLPDWAFTLEYRIGDKKYEVTRSTNNQKIVILDGSEKKLKDFRNDMGRELFALNQKNKKKYLTYRSLISRFIRPKKSSYISEDNFVNEERAFPKLINNAYLLGLDVDRVTKKFNLKVDFENTDKLKKNIEKDPILKAFFEEGKEIDIDIVDLGDKVERLRKKIASFVVAEDFHEIRKEADEISAELRSVENQATAVKNAIRNIDKSLQIQPEITKKRIFSLYEDAKVTLSDMVVKRISDVENFNKKLLKNRVQRLNDEKAIIEKELTDIEKKIKEMGDKQDEKLQYLNTHGALDEYTALNNQKSNYEIKLDKLKTYKELTNQYKNELEGIKINFGKENIATNNYLKEAGPLLERNITLFKKLVEEFYENKKAGIEVKNNEGLNRLRFDVSAKIQDDAGDGVNEVKIFCFDWTLLKARHNHEVDFLFHDGRLLSDMDPRQRSTLFRIAFENSKTDNSQYIISANQDVLESVRTELGEDKYDAIVTNNIVLELTDESDKSKLLGIQVDLDYESDEDDSETEE